VQVILGQIGHFLVDVDVVQPRVVEAGFRFVDFRGTHRQGHRDVP
ncbi:uncharacterized protein METZ01_LOCUS399700, partial [marine metagenome]